MTSSILAHWDVPAPYAILIGIAAGAVIGFIHFASLKWNTRFYIAGGFAKAAALQFVRFAVLVAGFALVAKLGWAALLAATAALTVVRMVILRREREVE